MNIRFTIKLHLCIVLCVHVVAMTVTMYTVNVATAYWGHFLEGHGLPPLFMDVLIWDRFLPWLSIVVVFTGIFVVFKASESWAMHYLACVIMMTVGVLCVTAVGLSLPILVAAKGLDRQIANELAQRVSTNDMPSQFAFITTNTTLQQVIDKVGKYQKVRGNGVPYYEYDLSGGSAVLVSLEWPFTLTNALHGVRFYRSTNDIISLRPYP